MAVTLVLEDQRQFSFCTPLRFLRFTPSDSVIYSKKKKKKETSPSWYQEVTGLAWRSYYDCPRNRRVTDTGYLQKNEL